VAAELPSALAAVATGSASPAPQREISARDVRDLALAAVEGAVAAEALAKELRRSPDRSRHFADIAERLRAVVGRASIRTALAEDATGTTLTLSGMRTASVVAALPSIAPLPSVPSPAPPTPPVPVRPSPPPIPTPKPPSADEIARAVATLLHVEQRERVLDETATRLARIEKLVVASVDRVDATVQQALARSGAGERLVVSTAGEAIGVAQKLVERVAARGPVIVRIE